MSDDIHYESTCSKADQIDDLLDQWEDAAERGQLMSAEELCRRCPELLNAFVSVCKTIA